MDALNVTESLFDVPLKVEPQYVDKYENGENISI